MNRREFLQTSLATAAVLGAPAAASSQTSTPTLLEPVGELVDVNVSLSRWPFRRVPYDQPAELVAKLRGYHVAQAWTGSFDALLHKDVAGVNARLAEDCRQFGGEMLIPFGTVNPMLPDWEEDLRRCHEVHRMPGIRLHPDYHRYKLDDPVFLRLAQLAAERGLIVQLAITMEDERTHHPLVQVPPVDARPLIEMIPKIPGLRLILLNSSRNVRADLLLKLIATGQVMIEISWLETVGGLGTLLKQVPADRVLFGSHAPLFVFESALLKLRESVLTEAQAQAVQAGNARRWVNA